MRKLLAIATLMLVLPVSARAQSPVPAGKIVADSSPVIVAADSSTITFRPDALFDIQITVPGESARSGAGVYMVAVPRNEAITMAIKGRGALGFEVAGAAKIDGRAVVLSAGDGHAGAWGHDLHAQAAPSAYMSSPVETASGAADDDGAFISVGGVGSALDLPVDVQKGAPDDAADREGDKAAAHGSRSAAPIHP